MHFLSQIVPNPRESMRSRPRLHLHVLPALLRPNLFSGD